MSQAHAFAEPLLSSEEESTLIERWQKNGDPAARDRLVRAHMRLCYAVASRYDRNEEHVRDLAQEGVFGLLRAADKYEAHHGTRFATYARWWVMTYIAQAVGKVAAVVDMPARTLIGARSSEPDDETHSWAARQAAKGELPLDAPLTEDSAASAADFLICNRPEPEEVAAEARLADLFRRSVAAGLDTAMSAREADIIARRFLIEPPETLDAIAADYGISRERIRQIEIAARGKLRRHLVNSGFPRYALRD